VDDTKDYHVLEHFVFDDPWIPLPGINVALKAFTVITKDLPSATCWEAGSVI
jgi:hypothetical protein